MSFSRLIACFIRLVLTSLLLSFAAQAGESRVTKCILKEVRGTLASRAHDSHLELGADISLEISGSKKSIPASYLGLGEGKFGPEYVLYEVKNNTYYHIPWEKLSVTNPGTGKTTHMPLSQHWVAQVAKNTDNSCHVHAASDCAFYLKDVAMNSMGYPNAETAEQRKALYKKAWDIIIDSKTLKTRSKYEDFFNEEGIAVEVVQAADHGAMDQVSAHLQSGKPVFMTYFGRETRFSDKTIVHWEEHPPSEKIAFDKKKFRPDTKPDEGMGHAVLALGIFKPKGGEKSVLILDSSDGGYRVWTWSEFTKSSVNKPSVFYLADIKKEAWDLRGKDLSFDVSQKRDKPSH